MSGFRSWVLTLAAMLAAAGCSDGGRAPNGAFEAQAPDADPERGPNGGRLLRDGDFALELAIFESGVEPELRAWATNGGRAVAADAVDLSVTLMRLDAVDRIAFEPAGAFLRGDAVIYEPHSFAVAVEAVHAGRSHRWEYESFEGRTRISSEIAAALGIRTELAAPGVLEETLQLYGHIVASPERVRHVSARFDGTIRTVAVAPGASVRAGQALATIESNESLQTYDIVAPIAGVVTERAANPGEQTAGRRLFAIVDLASVWAELAVFPGDRSRVRTGAPVSITPAGGGRSVRGAIDSIGIIADANQAVTARVVLDNGDGLLLPGLFVTAQVLVGEHSVPLAVRRSGLQSFRDFTVVYAQVGDLYEVRMLELGRQAGDRVEVLGGLAPGTRYVTEGSYVVKADIEKSGAEHDH